MIPPVKSSTFHPRNEKKAKRKTTIKCFSSFGDEHSTAKIRVVPLVPSKSTLTNTKRKSGKTEIPEIQETTLIGRKTIIPL